MHVFTYFALHMAGFQLTQIFLSQPYCFSTKILKRSQPR